MVRWCLVHVSPSFLDRLLHVWSFLRRLQRQGTAGVSGEQGVRLAGVSLPASVPAKVGWVGGRRGWWGAVGEVVPADEALDKRGRLRCGGSTVEKKCQIQLPTVGAF